MEAIMMRLTKDIEARKKNEESLNQSMKERFDKCCRLNCENDQMNLELLQSNNNEQDLERQIIILRDNLAISNEYKKKFKIISTNLDEMLGSQKNA